PPITPACSDGQRPASRGCLGGGQRVDSATRARIMQFHTDQPSLRRNAGSVGILLDAGKEQDLLNMSGSPTRVLPLPQVVVAHEEYALFDRLLAAGVTPRLEANIQNTLNMKDSVPQWNTVAELRGSERPGQVVIVGAHLDSWDLGTGATDNGTGSLATLAAARRTLQSTASSPMPSPTPSRAAPITCRSSPTACRGSTSTSSPAATTTRITPSRTPTTRPSPRT